MTNSSGSSSSLSFYSTKINLTTTMSSFLGASNLNPFVGRESLTSGDSNFENERSVFYEGPPLSPPLVFEELIPTLPTFRNVGVHGEVEGTMKVDLSFFSSTSATTILSTVGEELLPADLRTMSESSRNCVIAYTILFLIASTGNLTVFASFYRQYKKHRNRISLLILHLSVADLIVSFCLIPIEIFWRMTIQWYGGNVLCKSCQFMRAFGLYLSSMVLICVSFDRFFAILFPLKAIGGQHRVKVMLWMAWIASGVFSAPQAIFFNVESHPKFPSFRQCVTSSFLAQPEDAKLYSIFSVSAMYFAPLIVIIITYTAILLKIIRKSRQSGQGQQQQLRLSERPKHIPTSVSSVTTTSTLLSRRLASNGSTYGHNNGILRGSNKPDVTMLEVPGEVDSTLSLSASPCLTPTLSVSRVRLEEPTSDDLDGRSGGGQAAVIGMGKGSIKSNAGRTHLVLRMSNNACSNITRAKSRTLKLTIVIVVVFVLCWTPYVVMTLWYMFDWETAQRVDPRVQDGLFLMAVANSCVNPLIYGSFTRNCCGITKRLSTKRRAERQTRDICATNGSN